MDGQKPEALASQLAKIAHYSVVLMGDLLRLESELLLDEMQDAAANRVPAPSAKLA